MDHFYDGQIRRYVTQMMRILSNFPVKDGKGATKDVPVVYGDLTRQVANIIRENSENKIPSAPRIACYITALELDKDRLADATYTHTTRVREKAFDETNEEYLNYQGKAYSVEKIMPTPYLLRMNADIWTTNTDQKLQMLEQILVLFNPALEMQTTDNFIDWTSITSVYLENVQFTNRSIPVGVESEIDIATLTFSVPVYISPPTKVKRMGAITNIITSMFDESRGDIIKGVSAPDQNRWDDFAQAGANTNSKGTTATSETAQQMANVNYNKYGVYLEGDTARIIGNDGNIGAISWEDIFQGYPGVYTADVSRIHLRNANNNGTISGSFTVNPFDDGQININFDLDSFPDDSVIDNRTSIDYIIDPTKFNPLQVLSAGLRFLILDDIGNANATNSAQAWTNNDGSAFVASANDIIEWSGSAWFIVFDASEQTTVSYTTNLNTQIQYRFEDGEWFKSVDGDYPVGTWRIDLNG